MLTTAEQIRRIREFAERVERRFPDNELVAWMDIMMKCGACRQGLAHLLLCRSPREFWETTIRGDFMLFVLDGLGLDEFHEIDKEYLGKGTRSAFWAHGTCRIGMFTPDFIARADGIRRRVADAVREAVSYECLIGVVEGSE